MHCIYLVTAMGLVTAGILTGNVFYPLILLVILFILHILDTKHRKRDLTRDMCPQWYVVKVETGDGQKIAVSDEPLGEVLHITRDKKEAHFVSRNHAESKNLSIAAESDIILSD